LLSLMLKLILISSKIWIISLFSTKLFWIIFNYIYSSIFYFNHLQIYLISILSSYVSGSTTIIICLMLFWKFRHFFNYLLSFILFSFLLFTITVLSFYLKLFVIVSLMLLLLLSCDLLYWLYDLLWCYLLLLFLLFY
jgi:hypothetical protein